MATDARRFNMKKMINKGHIEGIVSESKLALKVSAKGITYIGGKLDVATDDAGLNVVTVDFPYVAEKYNNGNENKTFAVLKQFCDIKDEAGNIVTPRTAKSLMDLDKEKGEVATMVRLDPSIDLNEWYKDENGVDTLVSSKKLGGGFAHIVNAINTEESARNSFECDMVITGTVMLDGDEEKGTQDKLIVKGCTFNFRNDILPVEFSVVNPNGMKYFENLDATPSTPVFTKVWGKIVNETITTQTTEESAFGEAVVKEVKKSKRDWLITGTSTVPYDFGDEAVLTGQNLQEAMSNRQIMLATKLQDQKTREAAKKDAGNAFTATTTAPAPGNFSF